MGELEKAVREFLDRYAESDVLNAIGKIMVEDGEDGDSERRIQIGRVIIELTRIDW